MCHIRLTITRTLQSDHFNEFEKRYFFQNCCLLTIFSKESPVELEYFWVRDPSEKKVCYVACELKIKKRQTILQIIDLFTKFKIITQKSDYSRKSQIRRFTSKNNNSATFEEKKSNL